MKILVIDDHQLVRDGLRLALSSLAAEQLSVAIVEADSHSTALTALAQHNDLTMVLLDLRLANVSTWDLLRAITATYPHLITAVLSASRDGLDIETAFRQGALGFISKEEPVEGLRRAVRTLLRRERYVSSSLGYMPENGLRPASGTTLSLTPMQRARCVEYGFTEREMQVFERALGGRANKVIASELSINENTVKAHLSSVYAKLGVRGRVQALALFLH